MAYLLLFFATSDFYRTNTDNQWYMYTKNEICQIYIFIVCSMKKKITFIIERQRTLCYSMFHCSCLLLTFLICYYNLFAIITYFLNCLRVGWSALGINSFLCVSVPLIGTTQFLISFLCFAGS